MIFYGPQPRHRPIRITTRQEEDAGQIATGVGNPDGFCTKPCLGVSVLHPAHGDVA